MIENKTIAVVKLNRGAWMEFREQLIKKLQAEMSLDTYSDEWVRKTDGTMYVVKMIKVDPNFLDVLIGFENACDASDLQRFLDHIQGKLRQYTTLRFNLDPAGGDVVLENVSGLQSGAALTGAKPAGMVEPKGPAEVPVFTGSKLDVDLKNTPGKVETMPNPTAPEAPGAPESGDTSKDGSLVTPTTESKE